MEHRAGSRPAEWCNGEHHYCPLGTNAVVTGGTLPKWNVILYTTWRDTTSGRGTLGRPAFHATAPQQEPHASAPMGGGCGQAGAGNPQRAAHRHRGGSRASRRGAPHGGTDAGSASAGVWRRRGGKARTAPRPFGSAVTHEGPFNRASGQRAPEHRPVIAVLGQRASRRPDGVCDTPTAPDATSAGHRLGTRSGRAVDVCTPAGGAVQGLIHSTARRQARDGGAPGLVRVRPV